MAYQIFKKKKKKPSMFQLSWYRVYLFCKIWGSHNDDAEDSSLLGCDAVLFGAQFATFRRIIMPSSSHSNSTLLRKSDPDSEGTKIFQTVRIYRATHHITMFRSTTDHIYDGSPIRL